MEELEVGFIDFAEKTEIIDSMMNQYGQELFQLVFSYVKNIPVAEDLTQDIFVKCYHSLHTYKGKATLRTWLWRIAINHCKDYLKSWYNNKVMLTENTNDMEHHQVQNVEQIVIQSDEDNQITASVMNLPVKYREVIYFYYYEELTIKDLAELLGINHNTVKTRLKRAKELLKKELEEL
jgi:RNA polymerase sigma-70 factor, ECF subfamily